MATRLDLPPPLPFDVRSSETWEKWVRRFTYYITAAGVASPERKKALLLHLAGPDVQDLIETITLPELEGRETVYDQALKALSTYYDPTPSAVFERHKFRQATQLPSETVDAFCTRLKTLSTSCNFGEDMSDHVRDQFIDKCLSKPLRRRLLREPDLKLDKLLAIARATEAADRQAAVMEGRPYERIDHVDDRVDDHAYVTSRAPSTGHRNDRPSQRRRFDQDFRYSRDDQFQRRLPASSSNSTASTMACTNCDFEGHVPGDSRCPARGRTCHRCNKVGHFGRVCRSSQSLQSRPPCPRSNPIHAVDDHEEYRADEGFDQDSDYAF